MITRRPARARGHANLGWLDSWHTFSFSSYYDPQHMGFRSLRVINDDIIAPGMGFGTHPHEDMEIITYVLDGELAHKDSTGAVGVLKPGIVQRMSAGTGVTHSEFNHSRERPVRLIQIWLEPDETGVPPRYHDQDFPLASRQDQLRLVASKSGRDGSLAIHQDTDVFASVLAAGKSATHALRPGRAAWVQVAMGSVELNGQKLEAGDGAAIEDERELAITSPTGGELLLFDLA